MCLQFSQQDHPDQTKRHGYIKAEWILNEMVYNVKCPAT